MRKHIWHLRRSEKLDQNGFIPMLVCLVLLIVAVVYVSYRVVAHAQH